MSYRVLDENDDIVSQRGDPRDASCDASLFAFELGGRYRVVAPDGRVVAVADSRSFSKLAQAS